MSHFILELLPSTKVVVTFILRLRNEFQPFLAKKQVNQLEAWNSFCNLRFTVTTTLVPKIASLQRIVLISCHSETIRFDSSLFKDHLLKNYEQNTIFLFFKKIRIQVHSLITLKFEQSCLFLEKKQNALLSLLEVGFRQNVVDVLSMVFMIGRYLDKML